MSTKSSFRAALERRGCAKAKSPVRSGFPIPLVLALDDVKEPVEVARLLKKRGLSLRKAHETLNRLANRETVAVELRADTPGRLVSELAALGETTTVDFYRHVLRPDRSDAHYVRASRWFTTLWGAVAILFALFAHLVENLIQAINILGSIFYGVVLGLFLVAFFFKRVGGTAVFFAALAAQALVIALYFSLSISFLWYNAIGCAACVGFSLILQTLRGDGRHPAAAQAA